MAVLPPDATFDQFRDYIVGLRGPVPNPEVDSLWSWRQKLLGIKFDVGRGYRGTLPADEQHLTMREREAKVIGEAKSQGRNIAPLGRRWV